MVGGGVTSGITSRLTRQAAGSLNYVGAVAFAEEGLGEAIRNFRVDCHLFGLEIRV